MPDIVTCAARSGEEALLPLNLHPSLLQILGQEPRCLAGSSRGGSRLGSFYGRDELFSVGQTFLYLKGHTEPDCVQ